MAAFFPAAYCLLLPPKPNFSTGPLALVKMYLLGYGFPGPNALQMMVREGIMTLTLEEAREWFQIRDHVRDSVQQLEVCATCGRVRERSQLIWIDGNYHCRPDRKGDCWENPARARETCLLPTASCPPSRPSSLAYARRT